MKKKYLLSLLLLIIMFLPKEISAAKVSASDVEVECVYDNGVVITAFYDGSYYGMSYTDMKLSNSITPPYNSALTYFYNESSFSKKLIESMTCPPTIGYFVVKQNDDSGNSVTFQVYHHSDDLNSVLCCKSNNSSYDEEFFNNQIVPGFTPTSGGKVSFAIEPDSALYSRATLGTGGNNKSAFSFKLVSERIYFNNDVTPNKQWAFKSEGTQAASNPTYIKIYEYTTPGNGTKKLAEKGNTFSGVELTNTLNDHDDAKTIFACFKPSVKEIDSEKTDMAYKFTAVRHAVKIMGTKANTAVVEGNNGYNCSTGYSLYREVNWSEVPEDGDDATSICDVIPETSLLIAKIINYSRIFVPIFLIILTAFDITKIVLTGDINEELPKRRKLIIIRMVVAIAFFFIPIFIQVFVSSSYGVDFGDISCLW